MKRPDRADAYMMKARRALKAAETLLKDGDTEGACNRAYYAMFYAAHLALIGTPDAPNAFKTHRSLITAFGKYAVLAGNIDAELGRSISQVQQLRQLADYTGDTPPREEAELAVIKAKRFVAAMQDLPSSTTENAQG